MMRVSHSQVVLAALLSVVFFAGCPIMPPGTVAPDASFEAQPAGGSPPLKVRFTDTSKSGTSPIRAWFWQFGDGVTSQEHNPSHIYYAPGAYTVSLTVTTAVGINQHIAPRYITVKPATVVAAIGPDGGSVEAEGARVVVPQDAFGNTVVIGVAPDEGDVPVNAAQGELLVSRMYGIAQDQEELRVDPRKAMTLEIPFIAALVPEADRNGITLQILARQENGLTAPILGEVAGTKLVAPIAGLPVRAFYGVVYRPMAVQETLAVEAPGAKAPTSYHWYTNAWRICYTPSVLQEATALRIGSQNKLDSFDRRDFSETQIERTLSDLRAAVSNSHLFSRMTGFISPALLVSPANEFTLILYDLNEQPRTNYLGVAEVTFAASVYGSVVVDPGQLAAISKRNLTPIPGEPEELHFDLEQKLDFANAFAQELFHAVFRGYDYPNLAMKIPTDLDANLNPRLAPFSKGYDDGLATFLGQIAGQVQVGGIYIARSLGLNEYATLGEPLLAAFSGSIPAYSYAGQDFFFYVGHRFQETDPITTFPKVITFIADSYEGVLELIRVREGDMIQQFAQQRRTPTFQDAVFAANVACDLAMQKTFGTSLPEVYWDYARNSAYENDLNSRLRPSDIARNIFSLNTDRFNEGSLLEHSFASRGETVTLSSDDTPMLRNVPPLSTRALLLSAGDAYGELVVNVNAYDWVPDPAGNSMKVKVYRAGLDGVELTAENAQVSFDHFGEAEGFSQAIVLLSNVTLDRFYPISITAMVKTGAVQAMKGILAGLVTEAGSQSPIAGVSVVVRQRTGTTIGEILGSTSTNSQGMFLLTDIPAGAVAITFTKAGYVTQTLNRTVAPGQTPTIVIVSLSRSS
jgi:hypothetical protein